MSILCGRYRNEKKHRNRAAGLPVQKRQEAQEMTEKAREARRRYKREWNRKNPDKVKAAQARYWERKAAGNTQADEPERQEA